MFLPLFLFVHKNHPVLKLDSGECVSVVWLMSPFVQWSSILNDIMLFLKLGLRHKPVAGAVKKFCIAVFEFGT